MFTSGFITTSAITTITFTSTIFTTANGTKTETKTTTFTTNITTTTMSGFDLEYSLYPDPEECSRNFSVAPRGPEYGGTYLDPTIVAPVFLPPGPAAAAAAAVATTTTAVAAANDEDEEEEDTPASTRRTTTITDQTPGGLANRVSLRDREAALGATAKDPARTTRWVCYVRGCAFSVTTTNKREMGRHWRGAHAGLPKAHDPKKVFGVEYGEWLADEGLRATWEATDEEEFEVLRGEQGGEEEGSEGVDEDEEMQE